MSQSVGVGASVRIMEPQITQITQIFIKVP